jgi:hypothetical protein
MWRCEHKECLAQFQKQEVKPKMDGDQYYFECPVCGRRNHLRNIGVAGGPAMLEQVNHW